MIACKHVKHIALFTAISGLTVSAAEVFSQENSAYVLEEVIVTAQKREESLQDIAASVTAISGDKLRDFQVVNAIDLESLAPSISVGNNFGAAKIFIRGIGLGSNFAGIDPSVALHVDGAVVSPGHAQLGVFYDVDAIEILRGPQGSLYGRNSTGGSINVITNKPTEEMEGYVNVTAGNYGLITTEAAIGGPIVGDKLLGRIAVKDNQRDGYGENELFSSDIDDADQQSVRLHLEYRPTENLSILLSASKEEEDDNAYQFHFISLDGTNDPASLPPVGVLGLTADDPRDLKSDYNSTQNVRENESYNLAISWDINDSFSLNSITNQRTFESSNVQDLDGSSIPALVVNNVRDIENFSQELQLNYDSDNLRGLVGAYYYEEELLSDSPIDPDPLGLNGPAGDLIRVTGLMDIEAWAVFANFAYDINEQWSVILGGRYSYEERSKEDAFKIPGAVIPFADEEDWNDFTADIGVTYALNDDVNLFAKFSQGFKSGAANLGQISEFVDPELVDAYEVGMKGMFLDNVLSVNATAFFYDFTDMQLGKTVPAPGGAFGSRLENAGESEVLGAELEVVWLASSNLRFDAQIGYLDTEIKDFSSVDELNPCAGGTAGCDPLDPSTFIEQQFAGNKLIQAPELTANIHGEYLFDLKDGGAIAVGAGGYYRSEIFFQAFNNPNLQENGVTVYNANIKYTHSNEKLTVNVWGKNLTDKEFYQSKFPVSTSHTIMGTLNPPRTYGVTVGYTF